MLLLIKKCDIHNVVTLADLDWQVTSTPIKSCFPFRLKLTAGAPDNIFQKGVLRSDQSSLAPMHYEASGHRASVLLGGRADVTRPSALRYRPDTFSCQVNQN